MHLNSRLMFENIARQHFHPGMKVLEIGPDAFPTTYQSIVDDSSIGWDTIDIKEKHNVTFTAESEYSFPIADGAYDIVLSGNVIEHVRRIWVWIREVTRVCKPGGLVITITPVSWPYHAVPYDCWRIYPEGMTALYEDAGLEVVFARHGSWEAREYASHIPGRSHPARYPPPRWPDWVQDAFRALSRAGFPVERAYDTIAIGRKPGGDASDGGPDQPEDASH
jgi:SAM-dependent methyltransferase